jgi:hypothetical protein
LLAVFQAETVFIVGSVEADISSPEVGSALSAEGRFATETVPNIAILTFEVEVGPGCRAFQAFWTVTRFVAGDTDLGVCRSAGYERILRSSGRKQAVVAHKHPALSACLHIYAVHAQVTDGVPPYTDTRASFNSAYSDYFVANTTSGGR